MAKAIYSKTAFTAGGGSTEAGAEYNVFNEGTGLSQTIYEDRNGVSVKAQPAFADASGKVEFYIDAGVTFRVAVEGGTGTVTDRYQQGVLFGDQSGEVGRFVNELKSYTVASDLTVSDQSLITEDAGKIAQLGSFMTYGGTADAITLTSVNTTPVTAYVDGMKVRCLPTANNTGASTVNIDGLGAKDIVTVTGVATPADYIYQQYTDLTYNLANDNFVANRRVESLTSGNGTKYRLFENGDVSFSLSYETTATAFETVDTPITFVNAIYEVIGSTTSSTSDSLLNVKFANRTTTTYDLAVTGISQAGTGLGFLSGQDIAVTGEAKWY